MPGLAACRILELERMLSSTRSLLAEATGRAEAEEERKRRVERAVKREILKSQKVLKRTATAVGAAKTKNQ